MCPQSALAERWLEGDLSNATWAHLQPDLALARHVHLQGWGEPLLHPEIERMAHDAENAGCRVGLTTNGDGLGEATPWVADGGLDVLAVSVAGDAEHNRRLRDGSSLDDVLAAVTDIARRRRRRRPRLHVSYLLTRTNVSDLPGVVRAAGVAGADTVLVNHLDCPPTPQLHSLAVWAGDGVDSEVLDVFDQSRREARRHRVDLQLPATAPEEMLTCDLDPRSIVSVRWDGRLAPCVMLNLPVEGPIPRVVDGEVIAIDCSATADLAEISLREYLESAGYRAFIEPLQRRVDADARYRECALGALGRGMAGLRDLDRAHDDLEAALAEHPFPRGCTGCPKSAGW